MTTKRILIAIAVSITLGTASSAASLEDKPPINIQPIPDAAFTPDFDPEAAPLDEIHAHARSIFDELLSIVQVMPAGTPEQAEEWDDWMSDLIFLSARLRDTTLALLLRDEIFNQITRERALVLIASGHRLSLNPDAIEPLIKLATNGETVADLLHELVQSLAMTGDFDRVEKLLTDPRLQHAPVFRRYYHRPFTATVTAIRYLALAGEFERAKRLANHATAFRDALIAGDTEYDWTGYAYEWHTRMYLDARDPDSALRLIDTFKFRGDMNPLESELDRVAKEQARAGDLQAAATTRARYDADHSYLVVAMITEPARDLAKDNRPDLARALLLQGLDELLPDGEPKTEIVEIAIVQHELGFADDARQTIDAIRRLSEDFNTLIRIAEFELMTANTDAAKSIIEQAEEKLGLDGTRGNRDLAALYRALGDFENERKHLEIAIQSAINNMRASSQVFDFGQAVIRMINLGDTDAAIAALDAAIEAVTLFEDPELKAARYSRIGEIELEAGFFQRALNSLQRTMEVDESQALDLLEVMCERMSQTGRVSAALALANQVEDPLLRVEILQDMTERVLGDAEARQYEEALQALQAR